MNKKIFKNMLKEKETNTSSNLLNAGESVTFTNREKKKTTTESPCGPK